MLMIVGVPKEIYPGERRVALTPAVVPILDKLGLQVLLQTGAGWEAGYPDSEYLAKGAKLAADRAEVFRSADIIAQVLCHGSNDKTGHEDLPLLRPGQILVGFLRTLGELQTIQDIARTGVTSFAIELMPRTTRAQSMDGLSSQATISGYKAVILAADLSTRIFPMMTTAASTITPAKVLVIGAGVAGLQAIATAKRLGAVVSAYDLRPASKEQVQSVGGRFIELPIATTDAQDANGYAREQGEEFLSKQRDLLGQAVADSDIVISTAVVPGRKAPVLVTREMVARMSPGAVIVDLAAERGGNCELTQAGETVNVNGVNIIGRFNLPATIPFHASQMYARNLTAFLQYLVKDGKLNYNPDDEIHHGTLLTHGGEIVNPRVRSVFDLAELTAQPRDLAAPAVQAQEVKQS
jgi:NAD(P) transhydrogenase subunit alpha